MNDTLLLDWLRSEDAGATDPAFERIDFSSVGNLTCEIVALVAAELISARMDPMVEAGLKERLTKEKYSEMLEVVANPVNEKTQKGDLGEVLAAVSLVKHLGFVVPVKKMRYKIRSTDQQTGVDVSGFRLDEERRIIEICYLESKLRTVRDTAFAVEAHNQLLSAASGGVLVAYHNFLASALKSEGAEMLEAFLDAICGTFPCRVSFFVALHTDPAVWSETAVMNLARRPPSLDPLTVMVFRIADLSAAIARLLRGCRAAARR